MSIDSPKTPPATPHNTPSDVLHGLEVHLVGGAVRDELLGVDAAERDWVVVGSTPETMLARGFRQVGQDFPVFLHPQTQEEYALARTERKSAPGHTGFVVHAAPEVTLEQDLLRRDLSINAIAKAPDGSLTDPFGGKSDIKKRLLRHVSPAFSEDPLRVLRVARFKAQLADFGFETAPETLALMQKITASDELATLPAERVWTELKKALPSPKPSLFFLVLRDCGALKKLFPEIDALFGIAQRADYHPEVDTGDHVMRVVDRARELSQNLNNAPDILFAALTHDLGKALTPAKYLPSHHGHESAGVALVDALCERLKTPKSTRELARAVSAQHLNMHRLAELKPKTVLKLLKSLDAFRKPERVSTFAIACQADSQGRGGEFAKKPYPQAQWLKQYFTAANEIDAENIAKNQKHKRQIKTAIEKARIAAIRATKESLMK